MNQLLPSDIYKMIETKDLPQFKQLLKHPENKGSFNYHNIVVEALHYKNVDVIKYMVKVKKVDPSFDNNMLLFMACRINFTELVDYLLKQKTVTVSFDLLASMLHAQNFAIFEKLLTKVESPIDILKFGSKCSKDDLEIFEKFYQNNKESEKKKIKL